MSNVNEYPRIFISYSRLDGYEYATKLRRILEQRGFRLWQDLNDIRGGRDWWSQIELALKAPSIDHLVLAVTQGALDSAIVQKELRLARQEGVEVSPVKAADGLDLSSVPRWLGHVYDLAIGDEFTKFIRVLEGPSTQQRVPMMAPTPPDDYVDRSFEFSRLKRLLLDAKGDAVAITAALKGAGGYGKTTLAKKLCHDPEIQTAYFDGIIWIELGANPDKLLAIAADIIEIITGDRPGLQTFGAAAAKIAEALGDRRYLFVIDDVWREQDLQLFLLGAPNTTRLITTRIDRVIPTSAKRVSVDAMASSEAVKLLTWGLPTQQLDELSNELNALARRLGEWAILLKLVNGFLRQRVEQSKEQLKSAIVGVNKRLDARGMTAFDATNEISRHKAVGKTVEVSLDLLADDIKQLFYELAAYPEDVDIPISVIELVWQTVAGIDEIKSEDTLQEFLSLSLLLNADFDTRTVRLHDTVRQFLQDSVGAEALRLQHSRIAEVLLKAADKVLPPPGKRYYYLFYPFHLHGAGRSVELETLLTSPAWLNNKLAGTGSPHHLVSDYSTFGTIPFHALLGRTIDLVAVILARDPRQLFLQILSRLTPEDDNAVSAFLAEAEPLLPQPMLRPTSSSFTPPGAELRRFEGHEGPISAIAVASHDRIISGGNDRTVRIWDGRSGAEIRQLRGHEDWVLCVAALSPSIAVSGSADRTVRTWSLETGEELCCLEGHEDAVLSVRSLDHNRVISASADRTIRLWNIETKTEERKFEGHKSWVFSAIPLNAHQIVSVSKDETIRLWEIDTARELKKLTGHSDHVLAVARVDDHKIVSASADNFLRLWDMEKGVGIRKFEGHSDRVRDVIALNQNEVLSASDDRTLRLWDVQKGIHIRKFDGHEDRVRAITSVESDFLFSASNDRSIRAWDRKLSTAPRRGDWHDDWVFSIALRGGRALSASEDGTVRFWDWKGQRVLAVLAAHEGAVRDVRYLTSETAISGGADKLVRVWDISRNENLYSLIGHEAGILGLEIISEHLVVSASEDRTIRVWNMLPKSQALVLKGHSDWVRCVQKLDDNHIISGGEDRSLRVWDISSGSEVGKLDGHEGSIQSIAALDAKRVVTASEDGTVRCWDLKNMVPLSKFEGHKGAVYSVKPTGPDEIISASADKSLRLWSISTGKEVARLDGDAAFTALATTESLSVLAFDSLGRLHVVAINY